MYVGAMLILVGESIAFGSTTLLAYTAILWLVFQQIAILLDECICRYLEVGSSAG